VVGAYLDDIDDFNNRGSAYVFVRIGSSWTQQQKLTAGDGEAGDLFGTSVGISKDAVIAGASSVDIGSNRNQGSAYAFTRSCLAPNITTQPNNQLVCAGSAAGFSMTATGTDLSYQWRKGGVPLSNGRNVSGATSPILTLNQVGTGDAGSYDVVITGVCGTVTSIGVTLTVIASAISPTSASFGPGGGTGSVNVTSPGGCVWVARSNTGWITITSGSSGIANGTVNYSVRANPLIFARTGTMTIAGQTFTVSEAGGVR
jgi:hypothetical protein